MAEKANNNRSTVIVVSALAAWVAVVFIVTQFAADLEREKSTNTLTLITMIGGVMLAPVVGAIAYIVKIVLDTRHSVNGALKPRVAEAAAEGTADRFDTLEHEINEIKQALRRVVEEITKRDARLQRGDEQFTVIRTAIAALAARVETLTSCEVKPPEG